MGMLKEAVASYLKRGKSPEMASLLFLLNLSRDQLEQHLVKELGFERMLSGCLVKGNGPIILTAHVDTENTKWFGYEEDHYYPMPIKVEGDLK